MIKENDTSIKWPLLKQHFMLSRDQPNVLHSEIRKMQIPVLIIAGDEDLIRVEHSIEIYLKQNYAFYQLQTILLHFDSYKIFNQIVSRFISETFTRPDSEGRND